MSNKQNDEELLIRVAKISIHLLDEYRRQYEHSPSSFELKWDMLISGVIRCYFDFRDQEQVSDADIERSIDRIVRFALSK